MVSSNSGIDLKPRPKVFFEGELKMKTGFFFKTKIFVRLIVGEANLYWIEKKRVAKDRAAGKVQEPFDPFVKSFERQRSKGRRSNLKAADWQQINL